MFLSEQAQQKWTEVLDHPELPKIADPYKRAVTAVILENQEKAMAEESGILHESAPTNSGGGLGAGHSGPARAACRQASGGRPGASALARPGFRLRRFAQPMARHRECSRGALGQSAAPLVSRALHQLSAHARVARYVPPTASAAA